MSCANCVKVDVLAMQKRNVVYYSVPELIEFVRIRIVVEHIVSV